MSEGALSGSISAGALLRQSALLLLRHGLIVAASLAAIAAGALLGLYVAGHCFQSLTTACVPPQVTGWIGDDVMAVQYRVGTWGADRSTEVALAVALWCLFLFSDPGLGGASRPAVSLRRGLRFVARAIVYWVVFSATSWILGAIMDHVFGDERSSAAWLTFLGFVLVAIIVNTYLHAKLVFYVVSSVYEDPPKSLLQSWTASRNLTPALFRAFLVLELVAGCVQLGFWFLGYLLPGMKTLTTGIADWLGIASDVAYYVVPTNIGAILASALVVLMGGAISIVAFRADLAREYRAARVFE